MNNHKVYLKFCILYLVVYLINPTLSSAQSLNDSTINQIQVSTNDPRYLEYSDGRPYIPIGLNMISPGNVDTETGLNQMEAWMKSLSENGGNFIRLWLGHDFFDIEHSKSGEYDDIKAEERLDKVLELASKYNLKVKATFEHFRNFNDEGWDAKPIHHIENGGTASDVADFFRGSESRDRFLEKLDWFADRYAENETVFIWELWNEINAVSGAGYELENVSAQYDWTVVMLEELKHRFPNRVVTQSLGSFDDPRVRLTYQAFTEISNNDIAQVHRYLDLGAALEIAHGPVDVLVADAIKEMFTYDINKPVILAEGGAVEPNHTGPFTLYEKDKAGVILHDVLFAPFFAGSAGVGQSWHWGRYIDNNNLWFHFKSFAEVVNGINPATQNFQILESEQKNLRLYGLSGNNNSLIWCRDVNNTWITELKNGKKPEIHSEKTIDISNYIKNDLNNFVKIYDPWALSWLDAELDNGEIILPDFKRSVVVVIDHVN